MLIPREHGAYGQLLIPLGTALALGRPTLPALALAAGAVAAFLAHEPLLVLIGLRGVRARREHGAAARRWLILWTVVTIACGSLAAAGMPPPDRPSLLVPVFLAAFLLAHTAAGREHTASGELVAALTLSAISLPVALAARATVAAATMCWLVFTVALALATISVRAVVAGWRSATPALVRHSPAIAAVIVLVVALLLARARFFSRIVLLALLPSSLLAFALGVFPPGPKRLRTVGWLLVAATCATGAALIIGL